VDDLSWLRELFGILAQISQQLTVVFPVHPRTRERLQELGSFPLPSARLRLLEPLPYLEFLALQRYAALVITDSGGIQEETTFLGIPCLTVRENTERPITVDLGTNQLVGRDLLKLRDAAQAILRRQAEGKNRDELVRDGIPLWDGRAAERIAAIVTQPSE
jgi:UDP-N-acetylglucosamine 2-epimerase (non-hydrolysing)